jgi:uncharacterized protein (DUF305 family)
VPRPALHVAVVALISIASIGAGCRNPEVAGVQPAPGSTRSAAPVRGASPASPQDPFMGIAPATEPYDERFLDEMVVHHEGAIQSARRMIGRSQRPELRDLAQRIEQTQQHQIDQMRTWRAEWYGSPDSPNADMAAMAQMMERMMQGGMMSGGDTDRIFLQDDDSRSPVRCRRGRGRIAARGAP